MNPDQTQIRPELSNLPDPEGADDFTKEHIESLAAFLRWWDVEDAEVTSEGNKTLHVYFLPRATAREVKVTDFPGLLIDHSNVAFHEASSCGPWPLCEIHTDKVLVV